MRTVKTLTLLFCLSITSVCWSISEPKSNDIRCVQNNTDSLQCDIRFSPKKNIKTLKAYTKDIDLTLTKAEPYPYKDSHSAFLFLVDTSDPRRIDEIEAIKKHIVFILEQAKPYESFGLYTFNSDIKLEASIGSKKTIIKNKLNGLEATGRTTELYRSAIQAMRELNSINADRKTIIIFSDGQAEDTAYFHEDVIKYANQKNIIISSIGYPRTVHLTVALQSLRRLAEETGGAYLQTALDFSLSQLKITQLLSQSNNGAKINISTAELNNLRKPTQTISLDIQTNKDSIIKNIPVSISGIQPASVEETVKADTKAAKTPINNAAITKAYLEEDSSISLLFWYGIPLIVLLLMMIIVCILLLGLKDRRPKRPTPSEFSIPIIRPYAYLIIQDKYFTRHAIKRTICRIGRSFDNELTLDDNSVSRRHAEIHRLSNGEFEVIDLNSMNGLYVNQKKIRQCILEEADIIEVGDILLRFTFISADDLPDDATAIQNTKAP